MAILTTVCNDALTLSTDFAQDAGGNGDPRGVPAASGDNDGGQAACHNSYEVHFGGHEARPVPSFWNFVENELEHGHQHANNNHHQVEPMRHHA